MEMPPLAAIRVFESAARHLSFTRAAADLGMTQAGVSYQIKLLEERLGGALFQRLPRGLRLTRLGARLAGPTTEAFDLLRATYAPPEGKPGMLSISSMASLAGNWLSQRLGRFQMAHPALAVRLDSSDKLIDFAQDDVDVAIRYGAGQWPGLTADFLMPYTYAPILSPALAASAVIRAPQDLLRLPLLDPTNPSWAAWMREVGVDFPLIVPIPGLVLGTQLNEARAAMAGQGVALLTPRYYRFELATGALVQPFPHVAKSRNALWLVYPTASRNRPAIRAFRQFLLDEVAREDAEMAGETGPSHI